MATSAFLLREFFHLAFLRQLGLRLAGRAYAVKGGICLRFFHGSPRLSEDMDLDAAPGIRGDTLAKGVDAILEGGALMSHMALRGISRLIVTKPKQTSVTQRWKVAMETPGGPIGTKIEFSRRSDKVAAVEGVPGPEILLSHGSVPFAARYYDGPEMVRQKLRALAAPTRNAARDLFDLYHLLWFRQVPVTAMKELDPATLGEAAQKAASFSFEEFRAQVVPYLTEEMIRAYGDRPAFVALRDKVAASIRENTG